MTLRDWLERLRTVAEVDSDVVVEVRESTTSAAAEPRPGHGIAGTTTPPPEAPAPAAPPPGAPAAAVPEAEDD